MSWLSCCLSVKPKTPTLSVSPSDATIPSTSSLSMTCETASVYSLKTYTFLHNNNEVFSGAENVYTLPSVTTVHSGTYICKVTIKALASSESNSHTITVYGKDNNSLFLYILHVGNPNGPQVQNHKIVFIVSSC